MEKKKARIIRIDFSKWTSQYQRAIDEQKDNPKANIKAINHRVQRGSLKSWHIPELMITLVEKYHPEKKKSRVLSL